MSLFRKKLKKGERSDDPAIDEYLREFEEVKFVFERIINKMRHDDRVSAEQMGNIIFSSARFFSALFTRELSSMMGEWDLKNIFGSIKSTNRIIDQLAERTREKIVAMLEREIADDNESKEQ